MTLVSLQVVRHPWRGGLLGFLAVAVGCGSFFLVCLFRFTQPDKIRAVMKLAELRDSLGIFPFLDDLKFYRPVGFPISAAGAS